MKKARRKFFDASRKAEISRGMHASIAQKILEEANGNTTMADKLCDERCESIEEEPDASIYEFRDGSRIRTTYDTATLLP